MISSFDDFLDEGKVQVKRRYTENYPSKHVYSGAKIRNAVLSAIKDGVVTEEEFQKILDEAGASRIWKYKYSHLFDINEDGVKLSSKGIKLCPVERIEEANIDEVSTSIAQQRLMGMAYALKTGEMDPGDASDEVKDLAKNMTVKQLKDFASTKHKGLPYKKENENLTLPDVPGMGDVKLPGNPGPSTQFDNQKVGSGDIPYPIPNKKKIKTKMKLIPESFEEFSESLINEAFASSILQKISNSSKGKLNNAFYSGLSKMGIAASDIEDDQIIQLSPADAKKYTAKNPDAILIYYSENEKENPYAHTEGWSWDRKIPGGVPLAVVKNKVYMGLNASKWNQGKAEYSIVPLSGSSYRSSTPSDLGAVGKGGGKYESRLTTLDKMASVSDVVYVIEPSAMPRSTEKRSTRQQSRVGAAALISDKDFKKSNLARYNAILADNASKLPLDKEVYDAIEMVTDHIKDAIKGEQRTRYGEIMIGLDKKGREIKVSDATNIMRNLLDEFDSYRRYSTESDEGSSYYKEEAKKYAKSIVDRIRKIRDKDYAW